MARTKVTPYQLELCRQCERLRKRARARQLNALAPHYERLDSNCKEGTVVTPCSRALSFQELSRADNTPQQIAHTCTKDKKTRHYRYLGRILRKAAVKTTWVDSLGQDSSMCWTHIENFNLCEKFDKNTFC
jgi:hypothetical protein